ncbi:unnamed protein product [Paramecium pentaurelia]|uniref:Uncharacterized protein n=1 Tax=Paramecium pentaurelia TaxID=43138 RepID=A0A8S1V491_9CILI|nr:unnamed protein product [Paramecium pentaurelia]
MKLFLLFNKIKSITKICDKSSSLENSEIKNYKIFLRIQKSLRQNSFNEEQLNWSNKEEFIYQLVRRQWQNTQPSLFNKEDIKLNEIQTSCLSKRQINKSNQIKINQK